MNPNFPLYIVSKGRWESRLTVKALEKIGVPFRIVIEEQEYPQYAAVIASENILVLDKKYQRYYDTCDTLGDSKSKGPGPARNFVWDHALSINCDWHWVMDDNIRIFYRTYRNRRIPMLDGTHFRCMEDFVLRFQNVAMAGPNYKMFVPSKDKCNPIILNTRIYSCNLIRNDVPFRWRGRYNEDTDLSLRMLKSGWCTVQFNAFLQDKIATQVLKGGNTAEFYAREGTIPKSRMLYQLHPDVTRLVWKFSRPHHHVNYEPFKRNHLILKDGIAISDQSNDYGMVLNSGQHEPAGHHTA